MIFVFLVNCILVDQLQMLWYIIIAILKSPGITDVSLVRVKTNYNKINVPGCRSNIGNFIV